MGRIRTAIASFFRRVFAVLTFPRTVHRALTGLTEQVRLLTSASVESVSYVGVELRSIQSLLEGELQDLRKEVAELRRRLDAGDGGALPQAPFEVTIPDENDQGPDGNASFDAIVHRPGGETLDSLVPFAERLGPDGLLLLAVPIGTRPDADANGVYDEATLTDLLDGWRVMARTVVDDVAWIAARPPKPD
jgi:hypothetical protein